MKKDRYTIINSSTTNDGHLKFSLKIGQKTENLYFRINEHKEVKRLLEFIKQCYYDTNPFLGSLPTNSEELHGKTLLPMFFDKHKKHERCR